ncbi:MAG: hypothetical protein KGK03_06555 [Candidatus Omnitrophica bacterium]|nr:hypothetical protein [Candidatus Omnitrophota bacterium]MDE2222713.1 hypothetical protein [Candidatus Omnitrophota bacterium]
MKNNLVLLTAAAVFLFMGIVHISRLYFQFPVTIGSYTIPLSISLIAGLFMLLLAFLVYRSIK